MIDWSCKSFEELRTKELYKILQLRNEVFVVEQNCAYQDCDDKDLKCYHFLGCENENLLAYSRLVPPGISYDDAPSIGRVVTSPSIRNQGLGKILMEKSIEQIQILFGAVPIIISAQLYLKNFYESFSFLQVGEEYLEDAIPHIKMIRKI
jgi:ElaA protein